ncbi:MAG: hypothetical protein LBQ55_09875 [Treponema sp.]|jgi:hypothetical protein|nr:hypothetical protein [Treponema sp.]
MKTLFLKRRLFPAAAPAAPAVTAAWLMLAALAGIVFSCSTGEAIEQILGGSSSAPVFLSCKAVSSTEIDFQFSGDVRVLSLNFSPALEAEALNEGSLVRVNLAKAAGEGERLTADLLVEDAHGNTLNVLVPLRTRNDRMPPFLINELRTEHSKPRTEFIEIKTGGPGNLGALRLFIAGNTKQPLIYEFPPVEVKKGEYIVIHLRNIEEGTVNETGIDLGLSGGADAQGDARDFWIPGASKLLHKTDAVYFLDQDDRVIDGVMLSENPDPSWNKDHFTRAAEFLYQQGAWTQARREGAIPGPQDAVGTAGIKNAITRSVSRDETAADTNTAADWYITANSGATPGKPNSLKRFEAAR